MRSSNVGAVCCSQTALHFAAHNDDAAVAALLLEHRADPNSRTHLGCACAYVCASVCASMSARACTWVCKGGSAYMCHAVHWCGRRTRASLFSAVCRYQRDAYGLQRDAALCGVGFQRHRCLRAAAGTQGRREWQHQCRVLPCVRPAALWHTQRTPCSAGRTTPHEAQHGTACKARQTVAIDATLFQHTHNLPRSA